MPNNDLTNPIEMRKRAKELALRRLARSEISAAEMLRYLRQKKIEGAIAEEIVAEYVGLGFISDQRYAAMVARSQLGRGKGPGAVKMKLAQKGVRLERSAIKELVAGVEGFNEEDAALEVAQRRYPRAGSDEKEAARAFQALVRRGFSFEVARATIEKMRK